ncbi:MAG: hypothetical protein KDE27_15850 [Planctomycetes bacterium]|nr:hypothetical protein [Planctomycetota bacterium]
MPTTPRSRRHLPAAPFAALLLAVSLPCQTGTVHTGTSPGNVHLSSGWTRSLAAQPDGTLWCLLREDDGSGTAAGRTLRLFASSDQGANWALVTDTPTIGDGRGALAAGRECNVLHVSWCAVDSGTYYNLYHQAFDTATGQWIGTPDVLLTGTTADDQYYTNDIAVSELGTIGIAFNTHRTPVLSGFSGWSGGLFVKRAADAMFQGPYRCNTDSYGMLASMQAVGETFHLSFRTNTGLYGIRYRAFDAANLQFTTNADVPIYGSNQSAMRATNSSTIASDRDGNLYVLYSVGSPNPAGGALEVAFASAASGYSTWVTSLVETDAALTAGNVTYQHYTLARAENGAVLVVFAKASESYQNLWFRILSPDPVTGGASVVPDPATTPAIPLIQTTEADSFQRVDGLRAEALHSGAMIAWSGNPSSRPNGGVDFLLLSTAARTVSWGTGCQGSLAARPRLQSQTLPQIGQSFDFGVTDAPASAPAVVFGGLGCLLPPFDLGTLGMTGCEVFFTPLSSSFLLTDPTGAGSLSIAIPSGIGGGFELQFGGLVLAPTANPGGAVSTNALSICVN